MSLRGARLAGTALTVLGLAGVGLTYWMSFFWVSTEIRQGIVQRIYYVHVPSAWVAFLAFGIAAVTSAMYLWLRDERADRAALASCEVGMVFCTAMLATGPLWGKIAWGTYWQWEPRLVLSLLLWFIYLGYFMVRSVTENPDQGKRFAAIVAIVGAVDIPLIHMSVQWFRSLHPQAVVLRPDGPTLPGDMLTTLLTGFAAFTVLFMGLFLVRYAIGGLDAARESPGRAATA